LVLPRTQKNKEAKFKGDQTQIESFREILPKVCLPPMT